MPISNHMAIDPIGGAFRAFGPPITPAAAPAQAQQTPPTSVSPAGELPSQATLDAIRQALAMITSNDGTASSSTSDPLAAILATTDQTDASPGQDPGGSLGLDTFA
jgi:hypothetical protein